MFLSMGLQLDADTLNFFQSDNISSGSEKWKEGLRKPSPPRLRRTRIAGDSLAKTPLAKTPRSQVDGQKRLPMNGTHSSDAKQVSSHRHHGHSAGSNLQAPSRKPEQPVHTRGHPNAHQHVGRAQSLPVTGKHADSPSAAPAATTSSDRRRSSLSPLPQYAQYSASSRSRTPTAGLDTTPQPIGNSSSGSKPSGSCTTVKVKSSHIPVPRPMPAPIAKPSTVSPPPAPAKSFTTATSPMSVTDGPPLSASSSSSAGSGTQILYSRKPSLKLLSVTTSTSTKVQSVSDRSLPRHPPPQTHAVRNTHKHPPAASLYHFSSNSRHQHPSTHPHFQPSSTAFSSGIPQLKQPPPPTAPVHIYHAYDRLEGYQQLILSSPEPNTNSTDGSQPSIPHSASPSRSSSIPRCASPSRSSNIPRSASPSRSSSVNSDASQSSTASQKSVGGSSSGVSSKQPSSQSLISRVRRHSTPASVTSSGSGSRTPTPTTGDPRLKKSASSSSGEFYYATTDESSQESPSLTAQSSSAAAGAAAKDHGRGSESAMKLIMDHRTTSASPDPEILTMSALATDTVHALSTLMEVVTPATSTENLDIQAPLPVPTKERQRSSSLSAQPSPSKSTGQKRHSVGESQPVQSAPAGTTGNVRNPPISSSKASKTSIPTSAKPPSVPHKTTRQSETDKPPPIPVKQNGTRREKPSPVSPVHNGFGLQSPTTPHSDTTEHTKSPSAPVENAPNPLQNGQRDDAELHNGDHISNGVDKCVEDDEDFFGEIECSSDVLACSVFCVCVCVCVCVFPWFVYLDVCTCVYMYACI